ncbi:MAG: hypothetical protein LBU09_01245 [Endomicrobium sp.]|jgi:hypothetical protein|nr:hypothetical protein [Endomicrobium sp.]
MKRLTAIFLLLVFAAQLSSARLHFESWTDEVFEPTNIEDFKVYRTTLPDIEYEEIAQFKGRNLDALKLEACAIGADAFIITGAAKRNKGTTATAIKFLPKNNETAMSEFKELTIGMSRKEKTKLKNKLISEAMKSPESRSIKALCELKNKRTEWKNKRNE